MIADQLRKLRQWLGVALLEAPRYRRLLSEPGRAWVGLANRRESIVWAEDGSGVACNWEWTSTLHAPTLVPNLGNALLNRALTEFPVKFADALTRMRSAEQIDVSFVIGHRGRERLPLLLATLRSIAAQEAVNIECVVVEQSVDSEIATSLPEWVRYVHTPPPESEMPYARAWALNVGARMARGRVLVLHDNDLLVPACYAADHLRVIDGGFEVANLKRYLFYLSEETTARVVGRCDNFDALVDIDFVLQNALGGGSLVISRTAFLDIGGFDEDFVGWGGEDNEIWDRIGTLRVYPYGHLPMIHLWHAPQPGKRALKGRGLLTADLAEQRSRIPAAERIAELRQRPFGDPRLQRQPRT